LVESNLAFVKDVGYAVDPVFLWLPTADFAIQRVTDRVRRGGHAVAPETIRRRYTRGLRNFFKLYAPLVSTWRLYDSSRPEAQLVAQRLEDGVLEVYDESIWARARERGMDK
jgi:predicted ABC-type ATPase